MAEQELKIKFTDEEWEKLCQESRAISLLIGITHTAKNIVTTIQIMSEVSEPELVRQGAKELHQYVDKLENGLLEAIELRKEEQDV